MNSGEVGQLMNTRERIMRCQIEGDWTAKDMAESLMSFRDVYNLRLGIQIIAEEQRDLEEFAFRFVDTPPFRKLREMKRSHSLLLQALLAQRAVSLNDPFQVSRLVYPDEELKVHRVRYESPGFKDLAGIGEIVGHVKDFTLKLLDHFTSRRSRNLKDEECELRNQAHRIQNARDFVSLARECGFDDAEIRQLVRSLDEKVDPLVKLIECGKIKNVSLLDGHGEEEN